MASLPLASIGPTLPGRFLSFLSSRGGRRELVGHQERAALGVDGDPRILCTLPQEPRDIMLGCK